MVDGQTVNQSVKTEPVVESKPKVVKEKLHGFYKGYDMKWLSNNPDHPAYHLVEEFNKKSKKE